MLWHVISDVSVGLAGLAQMAPVFLYLFSHDLEFLN